MASCLPVGKNNILWYATSMKKTKPIENNKQQTNKQQNKTQQQQN